MYVLLNTAAISSGPKCCSRMTADGHAALTRERTSDAYPTSADAPQSNGIRPRSCQCFAPMTSRISAKSIGRFSSERRTTHARKQRRRLAPAAAAAAAGGRYSACSSSVREVSACMSPRKQGNNTSTGVALSSPSSAFSDARSRWERARTLDATPRAAFSFSSYQEGGVSAVGEMPLEYTRKLM